MRVRGLWKLPNGRDCLRGKQALVMMGRAMLSKSLIQFSIDEWSCVLSLLFTWGQTIVEVMKIMATSFKRSQACTATLSSPNAKAGHHWPMPLLETHGLSWASLDQSVVAPFSWILVHTRLHVSSKSLFPQSCVSSGGSMMGLMATSSKGVYAITRSAAPRDPAPVAVHSWPKPLQEARNNWSNRKNCSWNTESIRT